RMTSPITPEDSSKPREVLSSSDQDSAPALLPAAILGSDAEALQAARALAEAAAEEAIVRDRERRLPWELVERFTASGLGSIAVPREFGGPQLSFVTIAEVFRIISAADPALGQIPQNHFGLLGLLRAAASPAQKRRLFASVLAGWRIGNGGPERGSRHTLDIQARLVRRDGRWLFSGEKFYSTGAIFAHWVASKALDEQGRPWLAFIQRGRPGLRIVNDWSGF